MLFILLFAVVIAAHEEKCGVVTPGASELPWQAGIYKNSKDSNGQPLLDWWCSATLVSNKVVITVCPLGLRAVSGACILPPYPKNGNYTVIDMPNAIPGDELDSYELYVHCDAGFYLFGREAVICGDESSTELPKCIPHCIWEDGTSLSCGVQEAGQESYCYLEPESRPSPPNLQQSNDYDCGMVSQLVRFVSGGRKGIHGNVFMSGGRNAEHNELPWQAGIYSKKYEPYMQKCGGTLVSRTVVISAAHCFWSDIDKQLPAEDYAVGLGKIYRPWNDPNDEYAQKFDVKEIKLPVLFFGSATNFQEDIAVLVLTTAVHVNDAVRPACLDFDHELDKLQLSSGSLGTVAGWGVVSEDGKPSPTLQVAELPCISTEECFASTDTDFRPKLTRDKICAGYTNGTTVCKGDGGGGLTFPLSTPNGPRYYLRGVASGAPSSGDNSSCNVYHWATFTHVQTHQHFLQPLLKDIAEPIDTAATAKKYTNSELREAIQNRIHLRNIVDLPKNH